MESGLDILCFYEIGRVWKREGRRVSIIIPEYAWKAWKVWAGGKGDSATSVLGWVA